MPRPRHRSTLIPKNFEFSVLPFLESSPSLKTVTYPAAICPALNWSLLEEVNEGRARTVPPIIELAQREPSLVRVPSRRSRMPGSRSSCLR